MDVSADEEKRALWIIQTKAKPPADHSNLVTNEEFREFMSYFPDIVKDLTTAEEDIDVPEVTGWYAKALQYNVPHGKKHRGLTTVAAYKMLEKPENLTPENIKLANVMGWCIELLQGNFVIIDDLMDHSEIRRGAPCWHMRDDVGLNAINDALLIEQSVYTILKKYFSNHHCYLSALECFHDVTFKTSTGQALDALCTKDGKPNFELFTMPVFNAIAKYKTAYYTFHLPITLAMYLANLYDLEMHQQVKAFFEELGLFYQVQNDLWDAYADPKTTGKNGTDISEGKCTWFAVMALERGNPTQRNIMKEHYGRPNPESEKIIRDLFIEMRLPIIYSAYEEKSFNTVKTLIRQLPKALPKKLFVSVAERIYGKID